MASASKQTEMKRKIYNPDASGTVFSEHGLALMHETISSMRRGNLDTALIAESNGLNPDERIEFARAIADLMAGFFCTSKEEQQDVVETGMRVNEDIESILRGGQPMAKEAGPPHLLKAA